MNKYYIPEIEEFHIGFEFESKPKDIDNAMYMLTIFMGITDTPLVDRLATYDVRVKYLDRSDIESLGFKEYKEHDYYVFFLNSDKSIRISYPKRIEMGKLCIELYNEDEIDRCTTLLTKRLGYLFQGDIKNKSELKRLLKQIEIKEDE
jgi:hypothetical protein